MEVSHIYLRPLLFLLLLLVFPEYGCDLRQSTTEGLHGATVALLQGVVRGPERNIKAIKYNSSSSSNNNSYSSSSNSSNSNNFLESYEAE